MAELNGLGNITARCRGCKGAKSSFEWKSGGSEHGCIVVTEAAKLRSGISAYLTHRLYRCGGCGIGALALVASQLGRSFPTQHMELWAFHEEVGEVLPLPGATPKGIRSEFEEAEACMAAGAYRAAAGLFRSVLDKTLRANGYKLKPGTTLEQQIELAGADGVITAARLRRAHDEVRVLGNDVLHDEWRPIPREDVEAAHLYAQRIVEDFYDERESVLRVLREKGRVPVEDQNAADEPLA